MNIWNRPFLLLFFSAAVLSSLMEIFSLPPLFSWLAQAVLLLICLVGWRVGRSRLLRAGFVLQGLLTATNFLVLVPGLQLNRLFTFPNSQYSLSILSLLSVAVFLCFSYGIARWQTPPDGWLTTLQVVLALSFAGFLLIRNFGTPFIASNLTINITLTIILTSQFFIVLLLLLRRAAWRRAPVAIALLLVGRLIEAISAALPLLAYAFVANQTIFFLLTNTFRVFIYVERAAFPLFLLGLLALVQTERVRQDPQPEPVVPIPVPS